MIPSGIWADEVTLAVSCIMRREKTATGTARPALQPARTVVGAVPRTDRARPARRERLRGGRRESEAGHVSLTKIEKESYGYGLTALERLL